MAEPSGAEVDEPKTGSAADGAEPTGSATVPREWMYLAELVGLTTVVVTQPVLDVVQDAPDAFITRGAGAVLIVAYALLVGLGPALVLWLVEQPFRLGGRRYRDGVHAGLLGAGVGVYALAAAKAALGGDARPRLLFLGGAVAVLVGVLAFRSRTVRSVFRYLALALPVFLALFLFASPVSDLVAGGGVEPADVAVRDPAPVVLIVLDELPLRSLLDGEGAIDAARFPAFADLAARSTWYRNTTTVAPTTQAAVPAVLTGQLPDPDDAPVAINYDESLFTLLGGSYEVRSTEPLTRLCPPSVCGDVAGPSPPAVMRSLARASAEVFGDIASPRVDRGEVDFGVAQDQSEVDIALGVSRSEALDQEGLGAGATLDVTHVVLPHQPWVYLRSGATYAAPHPARGAEFTGWYDQGAADEARQRHLLQLQYADRLLGDALDRLQAESWWDDALVVVTADHGISFTDEQSLRGVSEGNAAEVLWVPLFVKYPGQRAGVVDDRDAETLDIVPTVADVVGADLPWSVDGVSLLGEPQERPARTVDWSGNEIEGVDGVATVDRDENFALVLGAEGPAAGAPADDPDALLRLGPYGALVGTEVDPQQVDRAATPPEMTNRYTAAGAVPPGATELPAFVEGEWRGPTADWVAVAVDGTIAGVGPVIDDGRGGWAFWTMLAERLVGPGEHEMEVFRVTGPAAAPTLQPFRLVGEGS